MRFDTYEQRRAAIQVESEELGRAYGRLKFREQIFRETCQSFVAGETEKGPDVKPTEETPEEKPVAKSKTAPKKKKAAPKKKKEEVPEMEIEEPKTKVEETVEPEVDPEAETEVEQVEEPEVEVDAEECPVKTTEDLRLYMTKRFEDSGKAPAAMASIRSALTESTGCKKVDELDDTQIPVAYAAVAALEL